MSFTHLLTKSPYQYYTSNNRLYSITTSKQTTGFINLTYSYDNVGNITNITDYLDSTKTRNFVYDDLNRLIQAGSTSYGGNLVYQYDKIGNMTYNCKYGNYEYDPDHPHAVKRVIKNGAIIDEYDYDANGNMTSGAGRSFTYDYDNRPTSIIYNSMALISVYDASGNRVKKVTPTSTTVYIGDLYECTSGQCTKYIFAGMQRVAKIDSAGTYYYHTDHLGSSNIITNSSGSKVEDLFYYPYGERLTDSGSVNVRHKFTGQEWDAETGLYYYGARYYDPKLARFISADTIVQDFADPQTLNRYSYTRNNPIIYTDPSGHIFGIDDLFMVVAAIYGAYQGYEIAQSKDANFLQTLGYMYAGAQIGAISGAVGGPLAAGGHMTAAIAASSAINSAGMYALSGGQTDVSISFGGFSYNFSQGEFGYLGKPGNSGLQNFGYGLGAFANIGDIGRLFNNSEVTLYIEKDEISHAALQDSNGNTLTSWGPEDYWFKDRSPKNTFEFAVAIGKGRNNYTVYKDLSATIRNVNTNLIGGTSNLLSKIMSFQGLTTNCVNMASVSLMVAGVPNIGIHPYLLYWQMKAREAGFYAESYSHYFQE